jgi:hypothetical protein
MDEQGVRPGEVRLMDRKTSLGFLEDCDFVLMK